MILGQKLRSGLIKPPGLPRIGRNAPRGLQLCVPFADPSGVALMSRQGPIKPTARGASGVAGNTRYGQGLFLNGSTSAFSNSYSVLNVDKPFSIEILFVLGAVGAGPTNIALCGYNNDSGGGSGTYDKTLGINGSGQFEAYVFSGSMTAVDTTTSPTAGTLYHLVMTDDGTTLRLYVNGVQTATQSVSGSYSGYGSPYFLVGATQANATRTTVSNSTFLLANIAWAAWTAAEVAARVADPFGFLIYPEDDLFAFAVGSTARRFFWMRA